MTGVRPAAIGAILCLAGCARPPSITYASPWERTSTRWVNIGEKQVPINRGVEWQGVKVYLSHWQYLVAEDAATGRLLWSEKVSPFWHRVGFKQIQIKIVILCLCAKGRACQYQSSNAMD